MKKIKNLIIIFSILILILIISIVIVNLKQRNEEEKESLNISETIDPGVSEEEINSSLKENDNELKYVTDRNCYETVKSIVQNYVSTSAYGEIDIIKNILSNRFMKEYNINNNNILSHTGVEKINNNKIYTIYLVSDMLKTVQDNYDIYIIKGKYRFSNLNTYKNLNILVILDDNNEKYVLYPEEFLKNNNYNNLKENDVLKLDNIALDFEEAASFSKASLNDKEYVNELFEDWNEKIIYDKQDAYSKLNNQYKEKRFSNYNSFNDYLSNKKYIPTINQYRVYNKDNYTDYICTDQYNNYYIFRVQGGVMRCTVFLDNYTVSLDTFKENYDNGEEENKVSIQVGKLKQMINLGDYNAIYSKLNGTFKNNNFKSISDLKNYLDKNLYERNSIVIENIIQKDGYYACECTVTNLNNTSEVKNMNIMVKLIDFENYEISFNIINN